MDAGARAASREQLAVHLCYRLAGRIESPSQFPAWRQEGAVTMLDGLSERERAVLNWLTHGLSNKEIGLALSISPRTVQKHLQRIYQHLGVQTRAEAIVRIHRRAKYPRV